MRKNLLTAGVFMLCMASGLCHGATADRIVAIVGGEPIMQSDVYRFSGSPKRMPAKQYIETLRALINMRLLAQAAEKEGIRAEVSESEVNREVEFMARHEGVTVEKLYEKLRELGFSRESHREVVRDNLAQRKLINKKIGALGSITPEEVAEYYKTHMDEFRQTERRHIRMISVYVANFKGDARAKAEKLADRILKLLKEGKEFKDVAVQYSQDHNAAKGGDWGWITREEGLTSELTKEAFKLDVGAVSDKIPTTRGYHIIKVEELEPARTEKFKDVQRQILEKLTVKRREAFRNDYINRLRQGTCVELFN